MSILLKKAIADPNKDLLYLYGGTDHHVTMIFKNLEKGIHFEFSNKLREDGGMYGCYELISFEDNYFWSVCSDRKYITNVKEVLNLINDLRRSSDGNT